MIEKTTRIFILIVLVFVTIFPSGISLAQEITPTSTPTPSPTSASSNQQELNDRIRDLEKKVSDLKEEGKTLSSQISVMDNQITLTEYRIEATGDQLETLEEDIDSTNKKIDNLEGSLDNITKTLMNRISATYQLGTVQPLEMLLSSGSFTDFVNRTNYVKIVQEHDKKLMYNTVQAKNDYVNQKEIFEEKKQKVISLKEQLEGYNRELDEQKSAKQKLLAETQGNEATYQRLLTQARAQLAGFKTFATTQGGSVLPAQPSPDGWYFNQRDERWGRNNIGSSPESTWEVGCLVTVTAMLRKQRGENITPADVGANASYFFSNTAMMLIPWNGGKFSSRGKDMGDIDSRLANGNPVIVGLNAGPYGTHFIVLKSGSNGNYIMNDPWYGPNLEFSSHYSVGQIFQYGYLL